MKRAIVQTIINADDLGMSDRVNLAIAELMEAGRISSATIMANGPAVQEAVRIAKRFPRCSFGIHLNLTEFFPMHATPELNPLLSRESGFSGNMNGIPMNTRFLRAVSEELSMQIRYLRQNGIALSHIDSHQHVHTLPLLYPAFKRAQRESGISRMRISRTIPRGGGHYGMLMKVKKTAFNCLLKRFPATTTTDAFCDFQTFLVEAENNRLQAGVFELMVHPGADEEESRKLCGDWKERLSYEISMINYNQLRA
jgi:chitin disaccharide deacetylase